MKTTRLLSRNVPLLLHDHFGIDLDASVPLWFRLWARRQLAAYVGVCENLGKWAERAGVATERIFVIENALDLRRLQTTERQDLRASLSVPPSVPIGAVVCGIRHEKGIDFLLEALAVQEHPFHAVIIGPDADPAYATACRALALRLNLKDKVTFLGVRSDVPALLRGCDFALMPSRSESGPLALIEYMAASLPFVSVRVGGIAERTAAGGGILLTPPGDLSAFGAGIHTLLGLTPKERAARGAWGPPFVAREFDIRVTLPAWERAYSCVLPSPAP
jgi:glycosyltransferase involved in cell wall biosynthesis